MNKHEILFSLDLNNQASQVYVNVRKGETAAKITAMLTGSCAPYSIAEGTEAKLYVALPSGTYKETACIIADGKISADIPAENTQTAGRYRAYFELTGEESALLTPHFTVNVEDPTE